MKFRNLTPHVINVHTPDGVRTFEPDGTVARVDTVKLECTDIDGIPTVQTFPGDIQGLPEPEDGVSLIVSGMVLNAIPFRNDVFAPSELIRNDKGQPIGCQGLRRPCL